jgi:hypothetical protein
MIVSTMRPPWVRLCYDPIGVPLAIERHRAPRPFDRREFAARILKNVAFFVDAESDDNDSAFIRTFADRDRGIDGNYNPTHRRRLISSYFLEQVAGPQGTLDVLEQFGVELPATEPRAFVSSDDLAQE